MKQAHASSAVPSPFRGELDLKSSRSAKPDSLIFETHLIKISNENLIRRRDSFGSGQQKKRRKSKGTSALRDSLSQIESSHEDKKLTRVLALLCSAKLLKKRFYSSNAVFLGSSNK